jgi:hypothetical protein
VQLPAGLTVFMTLQDITNAYATSPQVNISSQLIEQLTAGDDRKDYFLHGLVGSQDAFVAASVFKQTDFNHLFVLSDKEEAAYFQTI